MTADTAFSTGGGSWKSKTSLGATKRDALVAGGELRGHDAIACQERLASGRGGLDGRYVDLPLAGDLGHLAPYLLGDDGRVVAEPL